MFSPCLILAALLTNCADVASSVFAQRIGDTFDLTGQVIVRDDNNDPVLQITDSTGSEQIMGVRHVAMPLPFKSGDIIRATGVVDVPFDSTTKRATTICKSVQLVAKGELPPPIRVSANDIASGKFHSRYVVVRGRIQRIFRDEISSKWLYVSLCTSDGIVFMTTKSDSAVEEAVRRLVDAEIDAKGILSLSITSFRRMFGYTLGVQWPQDISIITPPPANPYDAPSVDACSSYDLATINKYGRRRAVGDVIAVCSGKRVIMKADDGAIHDVHLLDAPCPSHGARIEAVGIPAADYYQIDLRDASWRNAPGEAKPADKPIGVTVEQLLTNGMGHEQINMYFHGKVIRTSGTIIDLPARESGRDFAILKDKGRTILLDISSAKQILDEAAVGYHVEVTGVCTVNREPSALPHLHFQRVNGITVVVRDPKDVVVVSRPPWWTPMRLMFVVAALLLGIVIIFIWNRLLQRVIDRKSRLLLQEHAAHIKASLRVDERTRLAVELHDSLSQNLSGVACQIAATKGTLPEGADDTARHLSTAERMLLSCRTELRRCLWDLREDALAEKDFSEAVRKTLAPVAAGASVHVNFAGPRGRMDETTAHAILCIIRELVSNAVRHGDARIVHVNGEMRNGDLSISVSDDGRGFDPSAAPGAAEGHFGIEGVRERIKRLNGNFSIASSPGKGCEATATIPLTTSHQPSIT